MEIGIPIGCFFFWYFPFFHTGNDLYHFQAVLHDDLFIHLYARMWSVEAVIHVVLGSI